MESALIRQSRALFASLAALRAVEREHGLGEVDRATVYSVPRIVCIGEESSGKSSTLERLAMMRVFPRHERMCTRAPIEVRMRYRESESLPERFQSSGYATLRLLPGPGPVKRTPNVFVLKDPRHSATRTAAMYESFNLCVSDELSS